MATEVTAYGVVDWSDILRTPKLDREVTLTTQQDHKEAFSRILLLKLRLACCKFPSTQIDLIHH